MSATPLQDPLSSSYMEAFWPGAVGADTDLLRSALKKPCRGVTVGTPGILFLRRCDDTLFRIETFGNDTFLPGQFIELVALGPEAEAATATDITVWWT